jgi:hypothetical protein
VRVMTRMLCGATLSSDGNGDGTRRLAKERRQSFGISTEVKTPCNATADSRKHVEQSDQIHMGLSSHFQKRRQESIKHTSDVQGVSHRISMET